MSDSYYAERRILQLEAELRRARYDALTEAANMLNENAERTIGKHFVSPAALAVLKLRDK